jgi:phosphoribosylformylglycinamidine synthase
LQGDNDEKLDFNAVQRGDPQMEQKMNRVIRTCIEMGENNPIISIHDQGAGGPANVLKELVEKSGGRIGIRQINLGDPTLSVLKIWIAEYQERCGFLINSSRILEFSDICRREKVNCELLGEVTGDGRFVVYDSSDEYSTPVDLDLDKVLGNMPQKTFKDRHIARTFSPIDLSGMTIEDALPKVLRNLAVGSKRFLTNKVDRSVTGLVAQQQCCGPLQLTVSDVGVMAQSHFGLTGAATALGEQPIKMLVNPQAGARMAVTEALTNLVWAKIDGGMEKIKCSANWMWAPKLPGEGAALYDAACAMRDMMILIGMAVDGGKDSLSMATRVDNETVKSPRQLVISAYAPMLDITKVVTPDIKRPGKSELIFIDLSEGKARLGGSILAQVHNQLGDESPDMDVPGTLKKAFEVVQALIDEDLILSGHDVSDGGLMITLLEMAFAGNCGLNIKMIGQKNPLEKLFAEEAGLVIECDVENTQKICDIISSNHIRPMVIGRTTERKNILLSYNYQPIFTRDMRILREIWEETSHNIDALQADPECVIREKDNIFDREGPDYYVSFNPLPTPISIMTKSNKPKVAILREEGSNGDREMTSAFHQAGFETTEIAMSDLLKGDVDLKEFRGLAIVGGFSYADVPQSAKGWAGTVKFNDRLSGMFKEFYDRPDTFSLGVCNGCQWSELLGLVPSGIQPERQPRLVRNDSGRFESRWSTVKILESSSIMLKEMTDSVLGIWVAHGEGKFHFPNPSLIDELMSDKLVPMVFVNDLGLAAGPEEYPLNPNGSPLGITALCSADGRHLAMMPHPERVFLKWQWAYLPERLKNLEASPWLKMFQNAREWCDGKS